MNDLIALLEGKLGSSELRIATKVGDIAQRDLAAINDVTKAQAALIIQRGYRRHRFHKQATQDSYQTVLDLYPNQHDKTLSHYMFGKTSAIYAKTGDHSFLPVNPYVGQTVTSEIGYYRTDPLSTLEDITDIISIYDSNADHKKYNYIPITLSTILSIEDIIKTYTFKFRNKVQMLRHPGDPNTLLAFIKIGKSDSKFFQLKKILTTLGLYDGNFISKVASLGIKSSYWQIALQRSLLESNPEARSIRNISHNLPKTVRELKSSPLISKLKQQKDLPTKHLIATLLSLIEGMKDTDSVNPEALKRIALFTDLGVNLYSYNYDKFAFILYCVTHELTLLLHKKEISISYKEFLERSQLSTAKMFGLPEANDNLRYIAFPANSGTNALMLALHIAKKANGDRASIRTEGPIYFEFDRLNLAQITSDEATHDIYLITGGPTVWLGIYPGLDLNKVIREKVGNGQVLGKIKPMTLIIDATSGMHKNLTIDDDLKQYILDGSISIIINESHQKFGLGHSDQAQYGCVFGVCNNKIYDEILLDRFETVAEKDLQRNVDMQIGSYLTLHAEEPLERIKESHFANGALLRRLLSEMGLAKENMIPEANSLDGPENGLFIYVHSWSRLAKAIKKHFLCRDSFGHFNTTWCVCGPFTRLSVSASDKIDVCIEASEIYFACFYSKNKMITELSAIITEQMAKREDVILSTAKQVRLIGLMQTLMHLNHKPKNLIEQFEWALSIKYLREHCPDLVGRKSYHAILERQRQQSQQIKHGAHSFAEAVIYKLTRSDFSDERTTLLFSLLKEYEKAETKKQDRKKLPALQMAIILCGCTHLNIDIQKIKPILLNNSAFCKAIVVLNKLNLLSNTFYSQLNNGILDSDRYKAIDCLDHLITNLESSPQEKETLFKKVLPAILSEENDRFSKAVIILRDSQCLLSRINTRINSFTATKSEKEKLSVVQLSLTNLVVMLKSDIYECQTPAIKEHFEKNQGGFDNYLLFAQESRSNILKIIAMALRTLIQKILDFKKPPKPSSTQIEEATQEIITNISTLVAP